MPQIDPLNAEPRLDSDCAAPAVSGGKTRDPKTVRAYAARSHEPYVALYRDSSSSSGASALRAVAHDCPPRQRGARPGLETPRCRTPWQWAPAGCVASDVMAEGSVVARAPRPKKLAIEPARTPSTVTPAIMIPIAIRRCTRSPGRRRTPPSGTAPKNDGVQRSEATAAKAGEESPVVISTVASSPAVIATPLRPWPVGRDPEAEIARRRRGLGALAG